MTANEIGTFISQFGFPIVACAALFWQNIKQNERHKEESEKWAQVLENNTLALQKMEEALSRSNIYD